MVLSPVNTGVRVRPCRTVCLCRSEFLDKAKKYPLLVIWLYGAGGAGRDNKLEIEGDQILGTHIWTRAENQAKHPAFVLVPQSPGIWAGSQ